MYVEFDSLATAALIILSLTVIGIAAGMAIGLWL